MKISDKGSANSEVLGDKRVKIPTVPGRSFKGIFGNYFAKGLTKPPKQKAAYFDRITGAESTTSETSKTAFEKLMDDFGKEFKSVSIFWKALQKVKIGELKIDNSSAVWFVNSLQSNLSTMIDQLKSFMQKYPSNEFIDLENYGMLIKQIYEIQNELSALSASAKNAPESKNNVKLTEEYPLVIKKIGQSLSTLTLITADLLQAALLLTIKETLIT